VDIYHVPGCRHEVIKVGQGGFDDAIEEVNFHLLRDAVEYGALCSAGNVVKTNTWAFIGDMLGDQISDISLTRIS